MADRAGRRPTILLVLILIAIVMILFGLAFNFWYILLFSFMIGAVTPMTVMIEVAPRETLAAGISLLSLGFRLGNMSAAAIGGALSHPEETWDSMRFLADYPYLLPMVVVAIFVLIVLVLATMAIPETLL